MVLILILRLPQVKEQPGPTDYEPLNSNTKKAASYSFRRPTKPVYPDVMNYPTIGEFSRPRT